MVPLRVQLMDLKSNKSPRHYGFNCCMDWSTTSKIIRSLVIAIVLSLAISCNRFTMGNLYIILTPNLQSSLSLMLVSMQKFHILGGIYLLDMNCYQLFYSWISQDDVLFWSAPPPITSSFPSQNADNAGNWWFSYCKTWKALEKSRGDGDLTHQDPVSISDKTSYCDIS